MSYFGGKSYWNHRLRRQERVKELGKKALRKLVERAKESDSDTTGLTPRYIVSVQLRDEELPEVAVTKRPGIWRDVEKIVEANTNVRSRPNEVHGEIVTVWEWVGGEDVSFS